MNITAVLIELTDEQYVTACYQLILGREADDSSVAAHVAAIAAHGRDALRRAFLTSPEFAHIVASDRDLRGRLSRIALAYETGDLRFRAEGGPDRHEASGHETDEQDAAGPGAAKRDSDERGTARRGADARDAGVRVAATPLTVELSPITVPIGGTLFRVFDLPPYDAVKWVADDLEQDAHQLNDLELPAGATIVDVGAHIGLFTLWAARRWPDARILGVEPHPATARLLRANLALNGVTRATVEQSALSNAHGTVMLSGDMRFNSGGFSHIASAIAWPPHSVEVPCITFAELLNRHGIDAVDLLKVDCEGAEYLCLDESFPHQRVRNSRVEVHRSAFLAARGHRPEILAERLRRWYRPDQLHILFRDKPD